MVQEKGVAHSKDDFIGSGGCPLQRRLFGSGGGGLLDGSGGDLGGGSLGKGEVIGEVLKRDGGLVGAMGGCRPPTPAPAGWVRPLRPLSHAAPPRAWQLPFRGGHEEAYTVMVIRIEYCYLLNGG